MGGRNVIEKQNIAKNENANKSDSGMGFCQKIFENFAHRMQCPQIINIIFEFSHF